MSLSVKTQGAAGGMTASIFVTGLSESDTVTASNGEKTINGVWVTEEKSVATQVPVMTSNTTPAGVASSKSELSPSYAWHAFTGTSTYGQQAHSVANDANGWWVAYDFQEEVTVDRFEIAPQYYANGDIYWGRIANVFALEGSNDGVEWIEIQRYEKPSNLSAFQILSFNVANPQSFSQFRILWVTPHDTSYASCSYIQFYGTKSETVSGHIIEPVKDHGMWTVTATNGEDTVTQDVLVDGAFYYEIEMEMSRKLWLYRAGDECEDVTGGWSADGYAFYSGYSTYSGVKNDDNMFFALRSTADDSGGRTWTNLGTVNAIDFSGYSKIYMEYKNTTLSNSKAVELDICSSKSSVVNTHVGGVDVYDGSVDRVIRSADIALTGAYYINVGVSNGRAGYCYNVWLE